MSESLSRAIYEEAWGNVYHVLVDSLRHLDSAGFEDDYHRSLRSLIWGLTCSPCSSVLVSSELPRHLALRQIAKSESSGTKEKSGPSPSKPSGSLEKAPTSGPLARGLLNIPTD